MYKKEPKHGSHLPILSKDPYRFLAAIYRGAAWLYSGGAIGRGKAYQTRHINAGDRVCFIGVGPGEDALRATMVGARVTVIDRSEAMLHKLRHRFHRAGLPLPEVICADIWNLKASATWDVLVTNYFLNIFELRRLTELFEKLETLLIPGGLWLIADFAPFRGPGHLLQKLYWYLPLQIAHRVTGEEVHPIYDYSALLAKRGYQLECVELWRIAGQGPAWYRSLRLRKPF